MGHAKGATNAAKCVIDYYSVGTDVVVSATFLRNAVLAKKVVGHGAPTRYVPKLAVHREVFVVAQRIANFVNSYSYIAIFS